MLNVMVLSPYYPTYRRSGSASRLAANLEHFRARGCHLQFVFAFRNPRRYPPPADLGEFVDDVRVLDLAGSRISGIRTLHMQEATRPRRSRLSRTLQSARRLLTDSQNASQVVARLVARRRPDVLWVDHSFLAPLIDRVPLRSAVRIVDTHDVMHQRDASLQAAGLPPEGGVTRAQERQLLESFDLIVAIQNEERRVLQQMLPARRVITVEHAVRSDPQPSRRQSLCFVGSGYRLNVDAAVAFMAQSWPQIRTACPEATLEFVGGVCNAEAVRVIAAADARIVLRGVVPTIAEIYDGPAAVVCPLWTGSGLKIKLVEALAHGKATIASPIAAQGLKDGIDAGFLHAATPAGFVEPAIRLLTDAAYRAQWEQAATRFAARFEPEAVYQELDRLLFIDASPPAISSPRRRPQAAA